jgi:Cu/Ag efflux protein CusF
MRARLLLTALAFAVALGPVVPAPARLASAAEQASDTIAGEVTKIDLARSRVTLRSQDGSVHEFEASAETLKDLKIGDYIEAKRRAAND